MIRGFGHTGFLCDDLDSACAYLEESGVVFKKKPSEGTMRGRFEVERMRVGRTFLVNAIIHLLLILHCSV